MLEPRSCSLVNWQRLVANPAWERWSFVCAPLLIGKDWLANPVWAKEIGRETVAKLLSYGHRDTDMGHDILKDILMQPKVFS